MSTGIRTVPSSIAAGSLISRKCWKNTSCFVAAWPAEIRGRSCISTANLHNPSSVDDHACRQAARRSWPLNSPAWAKVEARPGHSLMQHVHLVTKDRSHVAIAEDEAARRTIAVCFHGEHVVLANSFGVAMWCLPSRWYPVAENRRYQLC